MRELEKWFYHQNLFKLQELRLSGNRVDTEGAKRLASALSSNSTLAALYLENNNIGKGGLIALADAWAYMANTSESRPLNKFVLRIWDNVFDSQDTLKKLWEMCQKGDEEIMTHAFNMDIDIVPYKVGELYFVAKAPARQ